MNAKLTLSLNAKVIESAKRISKKRGESISKMVEEYFKGLSQSGRKAKVKGSILELRGIAGTVPADFDYKKAIAEYLEEKYK